MVRNECENNTFTTNDNINFSNDNNNNNDNNGLRNQWQALKLEGDELFRSGQYSQASTAYQSAFDKFTVSLSSSSTEGGGGPDQNSSSSSSSNSTWREGAILQSNLVACYLKLQELDKALELSQTIVQDYPRWAKGYVRLASTYSALHRSNDACNALQRALQLDPNHPTAKSMLARELRGRNHHPSTSATSSTTTTTTNNTVDLEEELPSEATATNTNHWKDRILHHIRQLKEWYNTLNSDYQSLLIVFILLISLYISFGGRFGLGKTTNNTILHSHEEYNYNNHHFTATSKTPHDYYGQWKKKQNLKKRQLFSLQRLLPNHISLLDGSVASMICLALILYCCQRFGIQPLHAIMMIQWIQRANRHHPHPNFNNRMFFLPHRRRNAFRF